MASKLCCALISGSNRNCKARALKGGDLCFFHSPDTREKHLGACTRGGLVTQFQGGLNTERLESKTDVLKLLSSTVQEVRAGTVPPQVANTIGFLTGHILKAMEDIGESKQGVEARKMGEVDLIEAIFEARNEDPPQNWKREYYKLKLEGFEGNASLLFWEIKKRCKENASSGESGL